MNYQILYFNSIFDYIIQGSYQILHVNYNGHIEGAWQDVPVFGYGRKFAATESSEVMFRQFFTDCSMLFQGDAERLLIDGAVSGENVLELIGILFWEGCFSQNVVCFTIFLRSLFRFCFLIFMIQIEKLHTRTNTNGIIMATPPILSGDQSNELFPESYPPERS